MEKVFFTKHIKALLAMKNLQILYMLPICKARSKHLKNRWFFKQKGNNSEVDFQVDFELKNNILNLLMIKSFNSGLQENS